MLIAVFVLRGTHCFYIQSDIFTMASIAVFLQYLYLIKGSTQIFHAERFILIARLKIQALQIFYIFPLPGYLLLLPVRKNLLPDVRSMVLLNI